MIPPREEIAVSNQMSSFNRLSETRALLHPESLTNRLSKWTLYLSPLIFFFICFVFLIVVLSLNYVHADSNIVSAENTLTALAKNLQKNPIIKLKALEQEAAGQPEAQCEAGFTKELIYNWPGIESGCLCPDGTVHNWAYCQLYGKCSWINALNAQEFKHWTANYICVKRLKTEDWTLVAPRTAGQTDATADSCPSGYRVSTTTNFLCLKDGVTDKVVTKATVAGGSRRRAIDSKIHKVAALTVTGEEENDKEWLVDLVTSKAGAPCLDPTLRPKTKASYPLFKIKENGCGENFGQETIYTKSLQKRGQKEFYTDNGIYETVIKKLEFFTQTYISTQDEFELFSESRAPLEKTKYCMHISPSELEYSANSVSSLLDTIYIYSSICLGLAVVGLVLTLGQYLFRNIRLFKHYPCQGNTIPYFIFLLALVVSILLIIQAGLIWQRSINISNERLLKGFFEDLLSNKCFKVEGHSKAATILLEFFKSSSLPVYGIITFLAVWAMVWIIVFFVCYILRRFVFQDIVFTKPY